LTALDASSPVGESLAVSDATFSKGFTGDGDGFGDGDGDGDGDSVPNSSLVWSKIAKSKSLLASKSSFENVDKSTVSTFVNGLLAPLTPAELDVPLTSVDRSNSGGLEVPGLGLATTVLGLFPNTLL